MGNTADKITGLSMSITALHSLDLLTLPVWIVSPHTEELVFANTVARELMQDSCFATLRKGIFSTYAQNDLTMYLSDLKIITLLWKFSRFIATVKKSRWPAACPLSRSRIWGHHYFRRHWNTDRAGVESQSFCELSAKQAGILRALLPDQCGADVTYRSVPRWFDRRCESQRTEFLWLQPWCDVPETYMGNQHAGPSYPTGDAWNRPPARRS